jgi:hypothetical protein
MNFIKINFNLIEQNAMMNDILLHAKFKINIELANIVKIMEY